MAQVYTLANAKGGCGKSTVAFNLAVCFARRGYRTLAIDLDQQGNLSAALGVDLNELKKVRELRHDTALYRIYQAKAQEIQENGGKIKRVILDYEMKGKVNRDLGKASAVDPTEDARLKEALSQKHDIPLVDGSFVVPDVRVEYEDHDGNECRVDLEYLTETYRQGDISAKAQAGFALYAPQDQAARLHRVLDQHHIMTEILSL
jgi:hypothetical protein